MDLLQIASRLVIAEPKNVVVISGTECYLTKASDFQQQEMRSKGAIVTSPEEAVKNHNESHKDDPDAWVEDEHSLAAWYNEQRKGSLEDFRNSYVDASSLINKLSGSSQIASRLAVSPSPMDRAEAAVSRASRWHQGSGIQADEYFGMCEQCVYAAENSTDAVQANLYSQAASLWADAAEADAAYLDQTNGDWENEEDWRKAVGPVVMKAVQASKQLGMDVSEHEII